MPVYENRQQRIRKVLSAMVREMCLLIVMTVYAPSVCVKSADKVV